MTPRPAGILAATLMAGLLISTASADVLHQYTVRVDPNLDTLNVRARFSRPVTTVTARAQDAGRLLIEVEDCDTNQRLRMRNRRMMLPAGGIRCLDYTVDLADAAKEERRNLYLADSNLLVSPSRWLWRPELDADTAVLVRFVLPADVEVAVPWQRMSGKPHEYVLTASPESANAPALFGAFDYHEVNVPGATLRVSIPQSDHPIDVNDILSWIRAAATDVTLAYGRFPNPSPQVIVLPIGAGRWGSDRAVPFGRVVRDGGEVVELFVNQDKTAADFMGDWTATHEFSHLMLPYVGSESRWISEGFAQYYQNVLMARSGAYPEDVAWEKIHAGFGRGRDSRPELSPNDAASRSIRGARMKVYWTGAAIALLADVELRRRSGGAESLDLVLDRLQSCCLPSERVWTGRELFAVMDSLIDQPLFMPLYDRHANTIGFPDTSEVLKQLGVDVDGGQARLRRGELRHVRRDIMRVNPAVAELRARLAGR